MDSQKDVMFIITLKSDYAPHSFLLLIATHICHHYADSDGPVMPSHLFNQAYMTTELELPERGLRYSIVEHTPTQYS